MRFTCLLPLALLAACGGGAPSGPAVSLTADQLTIRTPRFTVPPGDTFECFYTSYVTEREIAPQRASGHQGAGGHHITVYYYSGTPRPAEHHPCTDAEMVEWNQVAGASEAGSGEEDLGLPDGLAMRVPAGKQIVLQAHYINVTGKPYDVEDEVDVRLAEPAKLRAYAGDFVINEATFSLAPAVQTTRSATCTVQEDLQVVMMIGHMHELGKHFSLAEIDEAGETKAMLWETAWQPYYTSNPPPRRFPIDQPLLLKKGTRLRQTCSWDNTTSDTLIFPREMCVGYMYYYPDRGRLFCNDLRPVQ